MNDKSLEKIQSATDFILWFRNTLPQSAQNYIRPYLAQPYQSALKVLDCCDRLQPSTVEEISLRANLNKETTRQILKSLQLAGLVKTIKSDSGWQTLDLGKKENLAI